MYALASNIHTYAILSFPICSAPFWSPIHQPTSAARQSQNEKKSDRSSSCTLHTAHCARTPAHLACLLRDRNVRCGCDAIYAGRGEWPGLAWSGLACAWMRREDEGEGEGEDEDEDEEKLGSTRSPQRVSNPPHIPRPARTGQPATPFSYSYSCCLAFQQFGRAKLVYGVYSM
jgi:hypothetical protein